MKRHQVRYPQLLGGVVGRGEGFRKGVGSFPEFFCISGKDMQFKEVNPMKRVLLTLALLAFIVGGASATPDDLCGCALITHQVPQLQYTVGDGINLCPEYAAYAISSAEEQINRIDTGSVACINWFILAAFMEDDKEWCGCQFGFDTFQDGLVTFDFSDACYPPTGGLEIPSAGWPGPLEGTALVVTGDPWTGNYVPIYSFGGYAYGSSYGFSPEIVQVIPDPSVANPFGGLGNCLAVPIKYDAHLGGLGVNMDGTYVEPTPCDIYAACCYGPLGEDCDVTTLDECDALGGVWHEEWPDCGPPNPCLVYGACCVGGNCAITTQSVCEQGGGEWLGEGTVCDPNPCPAVCCVGQECYITLEDECAGMGGDWYPDWITCTPNPCPSPVGSTSWGTIKALYR